MGDIQLVHDAIHGGGDAVSDMKKIIPLREIDEDGVDVGYEPRQVVDPGLNPEEILLAKEAGEIEEDDGSVDLERELDDSLDGSDEEPE